MGLIWEISLWVFLLVTVFLGGGAAWITGRVVALAWDPWWQLAVYVLLLAVAVRFLHFSLFGGSFFLPLETFATALHYFIVDFIVLTVLAVLGRQITRSGQMSTQYRFLYQRAGPFSWRERS
jgi:hypothetical protein